MGECFGVLGWLEALGSVSHNEYRCMHTVAAPRENEVTQREDRNKFIVDVDTLRWMEAPGCVSKDECPFPCLASLNTRQRLTIACLGREILCKATLHSKDYLQSFPGLTTRI